MKYWVVAAILLFNFIVQSAILPFLRIAGIQPDTLMVLVTCFGLLGGTGYGTFTGLAGGLLQDILYGSPVGLNGLHYMVIGFLTGLLYEKIFTGRFIIPTFIVFCASPAARANDAGLFILHQSSHIPGFWLHFGYTA